MPGVEVSGPLFDGRAEAVLSRFTRNVQQRIADRGVTLVRAHLAGVLRHPTGRYSGQIHTELQADSVQVTDRWIVYGPWLEGTGSRNSPVTRFPGYHTFRIVLQELDADAGRLANFYLNHGGYLEEMQ